MNKVFCPVEPIERCSGCGACVVKCPQKAIVMLEDDEGFRYPVIRQEYCTSCHLCELVCPCGEQQKQTVEFPPQYYAVWTDDAQLDACATVGVSTLIANSVLDRGGLVFGVRMNNEGNNAEHFVICSHEEQTAMRGSKYIQSDTGDTFEEARKYLKDGILVCYTGTPCQIAGLKRYLGRTYENLLTSELICHGVFSRKVFEKELAYLEKTYGGKPENFRFRSTKNYPWISGGVVNFDVSREGGRQHIEIPARYSPMCYAFSRSEDKLHYTLRKSCYNCRFRGLPRQSDITVGDAWGMDQHYPEIFTSERKHKGVSLVIVNSEKGSRCFDIIRPSLSVQATTEEKSRQNALIPRSWTIPPQREQLLRELDRQDYLSLMESIFGFSFAKKWKRDNRKAFIKKLLIALGAHRMKHLLSSALAPKN